MTKGQAAEYLKWFLANRDRRIAVLLDHLGIEKAETIPDLEEALLAAADWLRAHAYFEPVDPATVEQWHREIGERFTGMVATKQISLETVAFCYDMSFLLGKLFKEYLPDFDYTIRLGDKRNVDYGHIVLAKKGKVDINSYGLCTVMAGDAIDEMLKEGDVLKTVRINVQYRM